MFSQQAPVADSSPSMSSPPVLDAARRPWWRSSASPRPALRTVALALIAAALGLLGLAALTEVTGSPFLIPSMAASMALVVGAPKLPLSQPRNVIGGQIVSAAVGASVGLLGQSLWLGALAGALALAAMMLARVPHSPAAATAVIGTTATTVPSWEFILLAGSAAAVLVLVGLVVNRLNGAPEYPLYIW